MLLMEQENKKIKVTITGTDKIVVNFENELNYDKEFAKKIVLLVTDKTGIKFTLKDKKAAIYADT